MVKKLLATLVLLGAILVISVRAGGEIQFPENYYNRPAIAAMWLDGHDLHTVLSNIEWNIEYEYNWFDCTERAALMEFLAENAGYHAVIACGGGHCWLLVEFEEGWRAYDSMTFGVSQNRSRYYPKHFAYRYNPPYIYERVYDYTPWEVDWWNVVDWGNPFEIDIRWSSPPREPWRQE